MGMGLLYRRTKQGEGLFRFHGWFLRRDVATATWCPFFVGEERWSRLGLDATYFGGERSFVVGDAPSFAEVVRLGDLLDKNCTDASGFLGQRAIGFL